MKPRMALLIGMIFGAAALRLVPHPANFDAIGALALFGGAHFVDKRWAFILPLAALFLSDVLIGFHAQMPLVYGVFVLMVFMGFALREQRGALPVAVMAVAGSVLFFVVTNFGVWALDGLYPLTLQGLATCYLAALPFFQNTLAGTLFYTAVLFGGFALIERKLPIFAAAQS
jgi:hypothetical protein